MTDRPIDTGDTSHTQAPPDPSEPNRAPSDLTKEYVGEGIKVAWYASRCIHSAACIRAAPGVFDSRRRPWIDLRGANPAIVADAVQRCPTGALHYERTDGAPAEPIPEQAEIVTVRNGPYLIRGVIELHAEDGRLIRRDSRLALCRCGKSKHLPFCDNTHRAIGFRSA